MPWEFQNKGVTLKMMIRIDIFYICITNTGLLLIESIYWSRSMDHYYSLYITIRCYEHILVSITCAGAIISCKNVNWMCWLCSHCGNIFNFWTNTLFVIRMNCSFYIETHIHTVNDNNINLLFKQHLCPILFLFLLLTSSCRTSSAVCALDSCF